MARQNNAKDGEEALPARSLDGAYTPGTTSESTIRVLHPRLELCKYSEDRKTPGPTIAWTSCGRLRLGAAGAMSGGRISDTSGRGLAGSAGCRGLRLRGLPGVRAGRARAARSGIRDGRGANENTTPRLAACAASPGF